jgi:hypothetical protein
MRHCPTCGKDIPNKSETCRICGAAVPALTLAEMAIWKHRDFLRHHDPASDDPLVTAPVRQLLFEDPTLVGKLIWYVHPQYDACFYMGEVLSLCADGEWMRIEDKRQNTTFSRIDTPWTRISLSCECG